MVLALIQFSQDKENTDVDEDVPAAQDPELGGWSGEKPSKPDKVLVVVAVICFLWICLLTVMFYLIFVCRRRRTFLNLLLPRLDSLFD